MSEQQSQKTYRLMINGQDVIVDAATLAVSEKRVKRYIGKLMSVTKKQTGSLRGFWGDIIMLNIITNKILKTGNAFVIEKELKPLNYIKKEGVNEKKDNDN